MSRSTTGPSVPRGVGPLALAFAVFSFFAAGAVAPPSLVAQATSPEEAPVVTACSVPDAGVLYRAGTEGACHEEDHGRAHLLTDRAIEIVDETLSLSGDGGGTASCPAGMLAVAGGWALESFENVGDLVLVESRPADGGNGWRFGWLINSDGGTPSATFTLFATCVPAPAD